MIFSHLTQFYGPSLKTAWIPKKPPMRPQTAPTPTFILIASSGAPEQTNDEIELFKQKFPKGVVLETSQYQGQMLWFKTFYQKLAKIFEQATADVYLFYTGRFNMRDRQSNIVGWLNHLCKNHRSSENTYKLKIMQGTLKMVRPLSKKSPTFVLIASSGALQPTKDGRGLPRVNRQVKLFKNRFPDGIVIETSFYQGEVLWFDILQQNLARIFQQAESDVHLFYTGHSYKQGKWHIDMQYCSDEDIQKNTIEWLVHLWKNNRSHENTYLYILLDCCDAGQWCDKLKKHWRKQIRLNIRIVAAAQGQTYDHSGFFQKCLLAEELIDQKALNYKLFEEEACYYFPDVMQNPQPLRINDIKYIRQAQKPSETLLINMH